MTTLPAPPGESAGGTVVGLANACARADLVLALRAGTAQVTLELARAAAEMTARRAWTVFGYLEPDDFARELLDRSGRWLRDLSSLGEAVKRLPALEAALLGCDGAPALGRVAALLVAQVATAETLPEWVALARASSVRELRQAVREAQACRSHAPVGGQNTAASAQPSTTGSNQPGTANLIQQDSPAGARPAIAASRASGACVGEQPSAIPEAEATESHSPAEPSGPRVIEMRAADLLQPAEEDTEVQLRLPRAAAAAFEEAFELHRMAIGRASGMGSFVEALVGEAAAAGVLPDEGPVPDGITTKRVEAWTFALPGLEGARFATSGLEGLGDPCGIDMSKATLVPPGVASEGEEVSPASSHEEGVASAPLHEEDFSPSSLREEGVARLPARDEGVPPLSPHEEGVNSSPTREEDVSPSSLREEGVALPSPHQVELDEARSLWQRNIEKLDPKAVEWANDLLDRIERRTGTPLPRGARRLGWRLGGLLVLESELERCVAHLLSLYPARFGPGRARSCLGAAAEELLGVSRRTVERRVGLRRALAWLPRLRHAYESGEMGMEATWKVWRILGRGPVDAQLERDWLVHAAGLTVRRLQDEALLVERRRHGLVEFDGEDCRRPPTDEEWFTSLRTVPGATRARITILAAQAQLSQDDNVFLTLHLAEETARDFVGTLTAACRLRAAAHANAMHERAANDTARPPANGPPQVLTSAATRARAATVASEPQQRHEPPLPRAWEGLLMVLLEFAATWDDPRITPRRDHARIHRRHGYRCMAPGCSARATLQVHHIHFRGHCGSDLDFNLLPLCNWHHNEGPHGTFMRVAGHAPLGLRFELGRDDSAATYHNDRWLETDSKEAG